MEYRKFGSDYVLRMQRGEEILEQLKALCEKEHITLASLSGLGACGEFTVGVFNREKFVYESESYEGDFEIASCYGTVTTMNGEVYLHVHAAMANPVKGFFMGGHLSRAVVSLTGEFVLHTMQDEAGNATVEREYSPEVGLNLFKFV